MALSHYVGLRSVPWCPVSGTKPAVRVLPSRFFHQRTLSLQSVLLKRRESNQYSKRMADEKDHCPFIISHGTVMSSVVLRCGEKEKTYRRLADEKEYYPLIIYRRIVMDSVICSIPMGKDLAILLSVESLCSFCCQASSQRRKSKC